jgi:hypothetical protein
MPHIVVRSVPFKTRLAHKGAKDLLARDKARAKKLVAGLHPHGPVAFHERLSLRRRGDGSTTDPASGGGSAAAAEGSIDVTDAGTYICRTCST